MARRPPDLSTQSTEDQDPNVRAAVDRMAPRGVQMLDRSRRDIGDISPPFQVGQEEIGKEPDGSPIMSPLMAHHTQPDRQGVLRYFDQHGHRLPRDGEPPEGYRPPAPNRGPVKQRPIVDRAIVREFGEEDVQHPEGPVTVGDINLTAWMLRSERYPFSQVRKAIQERYSKVCSTEAEAFDYLLGQGAVTPEQLRAAGVSLSNDA